MNKYYMILIFSLLTLASINGAQQEPAYKYKYVLRAEDTVVKTNAPLHLDCGYVRRLLGREWQGRGVEIQADGSLSIDLPLQAAALFQAVQFLESDREQKYIEDNKKDIYNLAYVFGLLDIEKGDHELVQYYKRNMRETIVLKEGLDSKKAWSDEQKRGLAHIDSLLRVEPAFKRTIFVTFERRQERMREFYLWEKASDVIEEASLSFGNQILNMTARAQTGPGIIYSFSSAIGRLMDQKQIEQNNGDPTYIRFAKPTPVAHQQGGYGGPPAAYSDYNSHSGDMWCP